MRLRGAVDLEHSLLGGQAFRWERDGEAFVGVVEGRAARLAPAHGGVEVADDADAVARYLRLEPDDQARRARLTRDPALAPAMRALPGLRLLRQDPWETTVAFITSANNNVLRIEGIVRAIAQRWGTPVEMGQRAFPPPATLAAARESSLRAVGLGYRAPFVREAARMVARGDAALRRGRPLEETREELLRLPGVGPKVADCVALFSLDCDDAFPIDRWMLRAVADVAGQQLSPRDAQTWARDRWGRDAGLAQQYLFHAVRMREGAPGTRRLASPSSKT